MTHSETSKLVELASADRDKTNEWMEDLGFEFTNGIIVHDPAGIRKFSALINLIASAIIDWADVEQNDEGQPDAGDEMLEWVEEYLVG